MNVTLRRITTAEEKVYRGGNVELMGVDDVGDDALMGYVELVGVGDVGDDDRHYVCMGRYLRSQTFDLLIFSGLFPKNGSQFSNRKCIGS